MKAKIALTLPGGGLTGSLYQVGALAALEDGIEGFDCQSFDLIVGSASGATVAAAIAGGIPIDRLYRALLDPVDNFFPLERKHLLAIDIEEYERALSTGWLALLQAFRRLRTRRDDPTTQPRHDFVLEQLDRFNDSLPAGIFKLDRYERFLAEFFLRRGVPNSFRRMPRALRVAAHDIDTGKRVLFGGEGFEDVPVSLACSASLALPLFFSPVRVGHRHYLEGGLSSVAHLDVAAAMDATLNIVVSPLVPVSPATGQVPTGHGTGRSVRDKGLLWMFNQAMRIGAHGRLHHECAVPPSPLSVLLLEPDRADASLFLHNPQNPGARRAILEFAYRTTRARVADWMQRQGEIVDRLKWRVAVRTESFHPPPSTTSD